MGVTLIISAPAKVNLFLAVGDLRADGYHDVTTVLHALELADTVTIAEASRFSFACSPDPGIPAEENLAARAARAMADRFGRPLELAISIEKRIPAGGGLGGASADAAAVLVGLAQLWGIVPTAQSGEVTESGAATAAGPATVAGGAPTDPALLEIARALGADVPFFLEGGAALYTGRGDVLARSLPALSADIVLLKPADPVPTAAAYAAFDRRAVGEQPPSPELLLRALGTGDAAAVASALYNNMTAASISLVPGIRDAFALLAADGAVLGSAMAGSGSTVFGICEDGAAAARIADAARERGFWATAARFSPSGCTIRRA